MTTPDKNQPTKHFFKIPANYFELSEEEREAFCLEIADILHADAEGDEVYQNPVIKSPADVDVESQSAALIIDPMQGYQNSFS